MTRSSVRAAINLEAFTDNPRSGDTTTSVQNTTTNTTTTTITTTAAASTSISMSIQEVQPDVGVEAQTQAQQEASRAKQDLEIKASVTSWDFWEGAYRREKEMRLRAEAGFGAHIVDQQVGSAARPLRKLLNYTLLYSTILLSTLLYSTLLISTLLYSTLLYSTLFVQLNSFNSILYVDIR